MHLSPDSANAINRVSLPPRRSSNPTGNLSALDICKQFFCRHAHTNFTNASNAILIEHDRTNTWENITLITNTTISNETVVNSTNLTNITDATIDCSPYIGNITNFTNSSILARLLTHFCADANTSTTPIPTTSSPQIPLATPPPPPQYQPIWDQPIVSKNGLVYVRGATGLHAVDAYTGAILWVYAAQPLQANGKAIPDIADFETQGDAGLQQVHVLHQASANGMCGGDGQAECRKRRAEDGQLYSLQDSHRRQALQNVRNCTNITNTSNASDCFTPPPTTAEPEETPTPEILGCGGNFQHGQGHLASDGSLVFPCRGIVQRICCASCSASVISNVTVYPGENVTLRLDGALSPHLTTKLWCLWYDQYLEAEKGSKDVTNSRVISTVAFYQEDKKRLSSAGDEVVCSVPGLEWDLLGPIRVPIRVVQQDAAGALHVCGAETTTIDLLEIFPPPPPSYLLYYVISALFLITVLGIFLFRMLLALYIRRTEYGIIEAKFSSIGLGGLNHEQYTRLLKFLKQWRRRQFPPIFQRWRRALHLERVRRKLWKSDDPMLW